MIWRSFVAAASSLLLLSACATTSNRTTPSGKPEVTVANITAAQAKSYITGQMINAGYDLSGDSQFLLTFRRHGRQPLVKAAWGYKVTYSIVEASPGVRVVADFAMVMGVGTLGERPYDTSFNQPTDPQKDAIAQVDSVLAGLKTLR